MHVFTRNDVIFNEYEELGAGVFGVVRLGFILSIQQRVAIKIFSEKLSQTDILAETKIALEMLGHPNFAYVFGIIEPNKLLMEYTDGETLSEIVKNIDLVRVLQNLHNHGILHNDLHSRNIILWNYKYVKVIDFRKAKLINEPVVYNIRKGSLKHKRYSKYQRHLAHELRNIPGSSVTCHSDIYSLGYNFSVIALHVRSEKVTVISATMLAEKPTDRPDLPNLLIRVNQL